MTSPLAAQRQPTVPAKHRLTATEFRRMAEAGIVREDDRIELIEGELIDMAPIGSNHASVVARLNAWLAAAAGGRFIVFPQNPVSLSAHSEPQPDLALLKPRDDYYRAALPTAGSRFSHFPSHPSPAAHPERSAKCSRAAGRSIRATLAP